MDTNATIEDMKTLGAEDGHLLFDRLFEPYIAEFKGNLPDLMFKCAHESAASLILAAAKRMLDVGLPLPLAKAYMKAAYKDLDRRTKRAYAAQGVV